MSKRPASIERRIKSSEERARLKLIKLTLLRKLPFECVVCKKKGTYVEIRKIRREGWVERRPKVKDLEVSHNDGDAFNNADENLKWRCRGCHAAHDAPIKRKLKGKDW